MISLFGFGATLATLSCSASVPALAQDAQAPRILGHVDDNQRITLSGNIHPLARPEYDRGPAPEGLAVDRIQILLKRSPEQEAALELLLAEQQDPSSANYHGWLSPEEFGERFGASLQDIEQVTRWLSSHGLAIGALSNSRSFLEVSGTAGQVRQAFRTEIHRYQIDGVDHWANATDPQIPTALAAVMAGPVSLNDFGLHPMHKTFGQVVKHRDSSKVTPAFTFADNGSDLYALSPWDFATLYNILPLWNAGVTGTGQTIAIVGQTQIKASDVAAFRKAFDLAGGSFAIITNGATPAASADDEEESALDVDWSGAVAKGAAIKYVTSASTNSTGGVQLSAQYIVDKKVANILSMSYGACEEGLGTAGNQFFNTLWQQAAGEGISVFVAAGDSGSAGCDQHGAQPPSPAQYGLQVNGVASTVYNVAVGGTDLNDRNVVTGTNTFSTYWNATNNATTKASLKKYVPETVWNDTCTILNEAACNNSGNVNFVTTNGGSGGKSSCTTLTGSTCSGGYAKPSWQAGIGVPGDGKRDIPDVSLFAGDGLRGTFYLICDTDASSDGSCNYSETNDLLTLGVGGTSASAPAMAGIQALINQKTKEAQGNPNPRLYALAQKETLSGCNSSSGSGSGCVFNDITDGTNSMPCYAGTPNCVVSTEGDAYGVLSGYKSGTGYDLASGLGSVNAYNLVNSWAATTAAPIATLSASSVAFGSQAKGTSSAGKTVTLTNTGTAALTGLAITLGGTNTADFSETNKCAASLAVKASCIITLVFKPAAAGTLKATVSIKDNASGSPETIALTGTGTSAAPTVTLSETTVAFGNEAKSTTSAAKTVTLTNTGDAPLTGVGLTLAGKNPADFVETNNCAATIAAAGKCVITLKFKPAAAAAYAATVSIKDDASGSPETIALTGTGITPGPVAELSATAVAFGDEAKAATSAAKTVTLTNSGTVALTGVAVSLSGKSPADFVESNNCTSSLAVGKSCVITVKFKPATAAAYTAAVTIKDNATGSPQTIVLSGTGITVAPKVSLSATTVTFANQAPGTTSTVMAVTLTNSGTAALAGVSIGLAGSNPADFNESNNCTASIAINAKCTISLEFKPAAAAAYTATVDIKDDAAGSPQAIALKGTGAVSTLKDTIIAYAGRAGISGYSGDGGAATKASFYYAQGTAEDVSGNVYIADEGNNVIRKVTAATGIITTVAGNGYGAGMVPGGYTGDGGPALKAELAGPFGLTVDKAGNIYIADTYNSAIRKVTAATGIITTVAGNGNSGYSGDGGAATQAEIFWPKSVALDSAGNIYIADSSNNVIRKVTVSTGKISTIAGGGSGCSKQTDIYGDGCPAVDATFQVGGEITGLGGVAVDAQGNVYVACPDQELVREIHVSTGVISIVAGNGYFDDNGAGGFSGDGGPATKAELNLPRDVRVDGTGNIFIADADNNVIREVTASTGKIATVAGKYYAGGGGKMVDPEIAPTTVTFATPAYVSIDPAGNLFITDVNNFVVDKVYGIASPTPVN